MSKSFNFIFVLSITLALLPFRAYAGEILQCQFGNGFVVFPPRTTVFKGVKTLEKSKIRPFDEFKTLDLDKERMQLRMDDGGWVKYQGVHDDYDNENFPDGMNTPVIFITSDRLFILGFGGNNEVALTEHVINIVTTYHGYCK
jgi:hypothetical protein